MRRQILSSFITFLWLIGAAPQALRAQDSVSVAEKSKDLPPIVKSRISVVRDELAIPLSRPQRPGIGSGLALEPGTGLLWSITDRGPNYEGPSLVGGGKVFYLPNPRFEPFIAKISIADPRKPEIVEVQPIRGDDGATTSGRPPSAALELRERKNLYLSPALEVLPSDENGIDPEGITFAGDGSIWIAEEYSPSLLHLEKSSGRILERFRPGNGLPKEYLNIQRNRGFEGIAELPNGLLIAATQSALKREDKSNQSCLIRLLSFNPHTKITRSYAYPIGARKNAEDIKISDLLMLDSSRLLALENSRDDGKERSRLMLIDLAFASDIGMLSCNPDEAPSCANSACLQSVQPVQVREVADLSALHWTFEKTEGLALLPDKRTLVISNDNDFCGVLEWKPSLADVSRDDISRGIIKFSTSLQKEKCVNALLFIEFAEALRP